MSFQRIAAICLGPMILAAGGTTTTAGAADATVMASAPAPTLSFTTTPTSITLGSITTLKWSATNATSCTSSGGTFNGGRALSGSLGVRPAGTTTYSMSCTGSSGTVTKTATVTVTAASAGGVTFPLHVESGKRYLIDAAGKPFLVNGDSLWVLIGQPDQAGVQTYLDDRKARGFNAVVVELIDSTYSSNAPADIYGNQPFTTRGDFSTPNAAYFNNAAYVIGEAQKRGMLVLLAPAYLGCCGDGWIGVMRLNGAQKLYNYGAWIANRFKSYKNILWVEGGDLAPGTDMPLVDALARGINSVTGGATLQTYHSQRYMAAAVAVNPDTYSWLNVNVTYSSAASVVTDANGQYTARSMPFFLIEDIYENGGANGRDVRQQSWQEDLSGATGQLMGNSPLWYMCSPRAGSTYTCPTGTWQGALGSEGAATLGNLQSVLTTRDWTQLKPSFDSTFLQGGVGSSSSQAVAAVAADRTFAVVYVPSARTLTLNLGGLLGPSISVRWYDPTNGQYSAATTWSPAAGARNFTTPGNNSRGFSDWALILESH